MTLPLVWDACALINLAATGQAEDILVSLAPPHYVVTYVRVREVQSIRPMPEEADQSLRPVDFSQVQANGLLQDIELTQQEEETQVSLAMTLDDGEAKTAAVAYHRNYRVVTDDRVAIKLLQGLPQPIPCLKTTEWLRQWADATTANKAVITSAIRGIELCARFRPRHTDPDFDWWTDSSA